MVWGMSLLMSERPQIWLDSIVIVGGFVLALAGQNRLPKGSDPIPTPPESAYAEIVDWLAADHAPLEAFDVSALEERLTTLNEVRSILRSQPDLRGRKKTLLSEVEGRIREAALMLRSRREMISRPDA
jgi:hypothetical protein